jgi:KaiC/GvpD/RAD55 family RecA-like ATPase
MNLISEIMQNKFLLLMINESEYENNLLNTLKQMGKEKICYVCLASTYEDVVKSFKEKSINPDRFFFIDTLSSHYGKSQGTKNCAFVSSPAALDDLGKAIKRAVEKEKCGIIIFDTISSLLIYQEGASIVRFTNNLVAGKEQEHIKKVFIVLKDADRIKDDNRSLAKDIGMFADKTISM